jgi:hypothetical protein
MRDRNVITITEDTSVTTLLQRFTTRCIRRIPLIMDKIGGSEDRKVFYERGFPSAIILLTMTLLKKSQQNSISRACTFRFSLGDVSLLR